VKRAGVACHQGAERTTRAHRPELTIVADQHELGTGGFDVGSEADQVGVVGHAHLVQDHQAALAELQLAVVEAPGEAGQSPCLADPCLSAQGARRLARRGRPYDLVSGAFVGVCHHAEHRRFP
jgi:hypothetical protein